MYIPWLKLTQAGGIILNFYNEQYSFSCYEGLVLVLVKKMWICSFHHKV